MESRALGFSEHAIFGNSLCAAARRSELVHSWPCTRSAGARLVRAISGSHPADPLLGRSRRGGFAAVLAAKCRVVGDLRQTRELRCPRGTGTCGSLRFSSARARILFFVPCFWLFTSQVPARSFGQFRLNLFWSGTPKSMRSRGGGNASLPWAAVG